VLRLAREHERRTSGPSGAPGITFVTATATEMMQILLVCSGCGVRCRIYEWLHIA